MYDRDFWYRNNIKQLVDASIEEVVMTTGAFDGVLINYCQSLDLPLHITYVKNPVYDKTNYIYSIYCAKDYLDDDIDVEMPLPDYKRFLKISKTELGERFFAKLQD